MIVSHVLGLSSVDGPHLRGGHRQRPLQRPNLRIQRVHLALDVIQSPGGPRVRIHRGPTTRIGRARVRLPVPAASDRPSGAGASSVGGRGASGGGGGAGRGAGAAVRGDGGSKL